MELIVERLSWLWGQEPLDGDHTEEISRLVLAELDERNGNATAGEMERAGWRWGDLCWMWIQDMESREAIAIGRRRCKRRAGLEGWPDEKLQMYLHLIPQEIERRSQGTPPPSIYRTIISRRVEVCGDESQPSLRRAWQVPH